ncbi:Panacea domain-containing protein [Staphylococcus simulans]|uniref:Panacea domain-containing protein n=1 Tax=Staphylococcus simulans TaxID=1286 RepID=UPI003F7E9E27
MLSQTTRRKSDDKLADHILYRAHTINVPITNLQLQKVWYFALGYIIDQGDINLAKATFNNSQLEAWLYGPVVPKLYEEYQEYRNKPISDKGESHSEFEKYDNMIDKLIRFNPFDLVSMSHTHTHWKKNERNIRVYGKRPQYKFEDLLESFHT